MIMKAMAFYDSKGTEASYKKAQKFAGKQGRVGTIPDLIQARINSDDFDPAWTRYFTTTTAEYLGRSERGRMEIVVAHGIGPMSTLEGVIKAYGDEDDGKTSRERGRIPIEEFHRLSRGDYGQVEIVPLIPYLSRYQYPFIESLSFEDCMEDPLVKARLGKQHSLYLRRHRDISRAWMARRPRSDLKRPFDGKGLLQVESGSFFYPTYEHYKDIASGKAASAHLLSVGQLCNIHGYYHGENCSSLESEISCHDWSDGSRFFGVKGGNGAIDSIFDGAGDLDDLIKKNWVELMRPSTRKRQVTPYRLMKYGEEMFTQVAKDGGALDTGTPEFHVLSMEKVGTPVSFRTKVLGYYGFFKYNLSDLKKALPSGANAYDFALEPRLEKSGDYQQVMIQPYKAKVDTSKRILTASELSEDFELMLRLSGQPS